MPVFTLNVSNKIVIYQVEFILCNEDLAEKTLCHFSLNKTKIRLQTGSVEAHCRVFWAATTFSFYNAKSSLQVFNHLMKILIWINMPHNICESI